MPDDVPRLAPLITAMGMSLLLQTLAMIIWKPSTKPYPILLPSEPFFIGGAVINLTQIIINAGVLSVSADANLGNPDDTIFGGIVVRPGGIRREHRGQPATTRATIAAQRMSIPINCAATPARFHART